MTLIIMLSVSMPSDIYFQRHIKARNPECQYAECCYSECRYAECYYSECRYAECRYDECRCADSATLDDENKQKGPLCFSLKSI